MVQLTSDVVWQGYRHYGQRVRQADLNGQTFNIGFETELFLVDGGTSDVLPVAEEIVAAAKSPEISPEVTRGLIEINHPVTMLSGGALRWQEEFLQRTIQRIESLVPGRDLRAVGCGTLPSMTAEDLNFRNVYPKPRYHALQELWAPYEREFVAHTGHRPQMFGFVPESIAYAGSICSFQMHLELPADDRQAAEVFNRILLVTPVLLAISGSGPFFLQNLNGVSEARIGVWDNDVVAHRRVFYGPGWVTSGLEVLRHYCEYPVQSLGDLTEDSESALRAHIGSIHPWLRLIPAADHWRIENRVIGSGAPADLMATAAFYYGLVAALADSGRYRNFQAKYPFAHTVENFNAAAKTSIPRSTTRARHRLFDRSLRNAMRWNHFSCVGHSPITSRYSGSVAAYNLLTLP